MWPNPQFPVDLVKFTKEILNGKFLLFCIPLGDAMFQPMVPAFHLIINNEKIFAAEIVEPRMIHAQS